LAPICRSILESEHQEAATPTQTIAPGTTVLEVLSVKRSTIVVVLLVTVATALAISEHANAQATNVSGLWSGTMLVTPCTFALSGRCNAQNKITLKLTQQNNRITGSYTCAYGTRMCRNGGADNAGKVVSGRVAGNQIRLSLVIPADTSICYYNGTLTSATVIHGTYMCFNTGDLVEEGIWDVKHASGQ
jgi:hypothetical protein